MDITNKQWKYINEGNAHVVIRVFGTNFVVRLTKGKQNENFDQFKKSVDFVNIVMLPLLFGEHAYKEEIIELSTSDISVLTENLMKSRPVSRQQIVSFNKYAILAPNLTMLSDGLENYCIEIKPKEGFLANSLEKYSKCYYCLKQFLKITQNEINRKSQYCPLNLYSGDRERMKIALLSLILCPQNNFKVFKNGEIVYSDSSNIDDLQTIISKTQLKSINRLIDFIATVLLSDGISNIKMEESEPINSVSNRYECKEQNNLPPNSFLYKLLYLQKLSENPVLDHLKVSSKHEYDYVTLILDKIKSHNWNLQLQEHRTPFLATCSSECLAMISTIARDCSIMIAFTEQYSGTPTISFDDSTMSYRIAVTDLEPKPIKTLLKRVHTENKLIKVISDFKLTKQ
ncbi:inositol-pentakisphosphate 2-kinase [Leptidea sinapis]|uniref:inositol-pentakisphosphate 2-kinase n=1 Tax=Leptidea sinapis TaxID=189913 RepID=UPI0021C3BDAD|nr:inositol-pentakisphosphate 2-kinase [Leptidea sinapis]